MHRKAMENCQNGRFQEAENQLTYALDQAKKLKIVCFEAKIINSMGIVSESMKLKGKAAQRYSQALELTKSRLGSDNKVYATIAGNLARVS